MEMTGELFHGRTDILDWAVSERAFAGGRVSGDACLVTFFSGGALAAVVDGLGHGPEAAEAADKAIAVVRQYAADPVADILQHCHERLRKTRGAVISLASFQASTSRMTWLGVGNVEGVLLRAAASAKETRESLLLRGGVVGYQIPSLRSVNVPISPGDILMFATDGISSNFWDPMLLDRSPQDIASEVLQQYGKQTDDALVLVARYTGGS
jgi:hypothetical protein